MGRTRAAIVDPGPDAADHVASVAELVADAEDVTVVLTHHHADHAGGLEALLGRITATVAGPPGPGVDRILEDADAVETDAGDLVAIHTPGHTPDHLCYHWPEARALFAGDLLLGRGDTTWVAGYPGCVADYLASLDRLRALDLERILPAHGPPLTEPAAAIERFAGHRRARIEQVRAALARRPGATAAELVAPVYGPEFPPGLVGAARESLEALLEHVRAEEAAP